MGKKCACKSGFKINSTDNGCEDCLNAPTDAFECAAGTIAEGNEGSKVCAACTVTNCADCSANKAKCATCAAGHRLKQEEGAADVCEACTPANKCVECAAEVAKCTKCAEGEVIEAGKCIPSGAAALGFSILTIIAMLF